MCGAVLRQKFRTEKSMQVESVDISFATYKRHIYSATRFFIIDASSKVVFSSVITSFNDNTYTNILAGFYLPTGSYMMALVSDVQDTFNSVSVWYNKTEGASMMFNEKIYRDMSIDFRLNEKNNSDANIAIIEGPVAKKRGRPKKR
jgi:hypothetical protein